MLEEWKRIFSDNEQGGKSLFADKKTRYILIIMISLGLIALIWPVTNDTEPIVVEANNEKKPAAYETAKKTQLAVELEKILSQIDGVGQVQVSITLASDGMKTYATNIRTEKRQTEENNESGKKNSLEESTDRTLAVSSGKPLLIEEKTPEILGVLVVADGARVPAVQEKLINATATLLQIPTHRVRAMPRKGEI